MQLNNKREVQARRIQDYKYVKQCREHCSASKKKKRIYYHVLVKRYRVPASTIA